MLLWKQEPRAANVAPCCSGILLSQEPLCRNSLTIVIGRGWPSQSTGVLLHPRYRNNVKPMVGVNLF